MTSYATEELTTDEFVEETLSESGVPVMRMSWGPNPPEVWATYVSSPAQEYHDNGTVTYGKRYTICLYMCLDYFDEQLADRFEEAVSQLGSSYSREDDYSDLHNAYQSVFRTTVVRHG